MGVKNLKSRLVSSSGLGLTMTACHRDVARILNSSTANLGYAKILNPGITVHRGRKLPLAQKMELFFSTDFFVLWKTE